MEWLNHGVRVDFPTEQTDAMKQRMWFMNVLKVGNNRFYLMERGCDDYTSRPNTAHAWNGYTLNEMRRLGELGMHYDWSPTHINPQVSRELSASKLPLVIGQKNQGNGLCGKVSITEIDQTVGDVTTMHS